MCMKQVVFDNNNVFCFCFCFFPAVFEQLRNILHQGNVSQRVQYMLEVMFAIRKDGFKVSSLDSVNRS